MEIKEWFKHKWHIIKVYCSYRFPYYDWWQCRKYIKIPHWHLVDYGRLDNIWTFGLPINIKFYNSILSIKISNVGWKDKYDRPAHEWNPYFAIIIFRKWIIYWTLCWSKDYVENMTTWEAILAHNYYNADIKEYVHTRYWMSKDNIKHYINTLK